MKMPIDWNQEKKNKPVDLYLDNLVDALMMMIYVVPINLRRFGESLYVKRFAQGSQRALSPAQQTSTISDLMRQERRSNATEK